MLRLGKYWIPELYSGFRKLVYRDTHLCRSCLTSSDTKLAPQESCDRENLDAGVLVCTGRGSQQNTWNDKNYHLEAQRKWGVALWTDEESRQQGAHTVVGSIGGSLEPRLSLSLHPRLRLPRLVD